MRHAVPGHPLWQEHALAAAGSPGSACRSGTACPARAAALQASPLAAAPACLACRVSYRGLMHVLRSLACGLWP